MGTSEIEYCGREISASDAVLQVWLALLADEASKLEPLPDWLDEAQQSWRFQATHDSGQGIVLDLNDLLATDDRRRAVLKAAGAAVARLRSLGDPIPAGTLNALGPEESPYAKDQPADVFIEVAEDFVDLLETDEAGPGERPITSESELSRALHDHARWLLDPTSGTRLFLRDAKLGGLDMSGIVLKRARLLRVDLRGARLTRSKIVRSELDEVNLEGADLVEADFANSKLRRCNLSRANARGSSFSDTLSEDCSFKEIYFERLRSERSSFFRANLTGATVTHAHLDAAVSGDLRRCNFSSSDLGNARFFDADLREAEFSETSLIGTGMKRVRLYGSRGVPFQADKISALGLDFSPGGDGSAPGTLARLREQLGGGPGEQPWGTATLAERYAAFQLNETESRQFSLERRSDEMEVIRVRSAALQRRRLVLEYQIVDSRLAASVAQHLIHEVLLASEPFAGEFRGTYDTIEYRRVEA